MRFQLLGPVEVRDDAGTPVALPGARARAILAMLVLAGPEAVSPGRLFETGRNAKDPVNALHVQIAKLRAALPEPRLVSEPAGYRLVTKPGEVDATVFTEACERGRQLAAADQHESAAKVLREALAGWREPEPYDFAEAWLARLAEVRLTALETVIDAELALGRAEDLVAELTGLTAAHPLRERFAGQLMTALHRAGRRSEALTVFAELRERLADELGTDPSPEIMALHLELLRDEPVRPAGNLPHPVGTLIGRDADLADVRRLLAEHRLVTVIGPGGVGKTRAARELGHLLRDRYRDGVWLVELAPIARDASALDAVASALGFEEDDRLLAYLRGREVLLVLDNCEHVIEDAAAQVRFLLGACPGVSVLATSREPLNVEGERLVPLPPLAIEAAMRLFRDRAPSARDDDAAVAQLCARLDRLPLALELAAAGARLFSLDQIESRLDGLANVSRHAPARHHSLRAVLDWSHELLSPQEKRVFAALSVFRDGCTFADAERVCGTTVGVLAQLVDKSLVVRGPDDRFRLLETVRVYAEATADVSEFRDRQAAAMLAFAQEMFTGLTGPRQHELMRRMTPELPNLRAVTTWLLERGDGAGAITLHGLLGYFWYISGREAEGTRWLGRAVECFDAKPTPGVETMLATALGWHSYLGRMSGRRPDTWRSAQRVRDLYRSNPDGFRIGMPAVAAVAVYERPGAEARQCLDDAEEAIVGLDEPWLRGVLDAVWSEQHRRDGDLDAAVEAARSNLRYFEELGDPFGILYSQLRLGDAEEHAGHRDRARARWERARDGARAAYAPVKCGYAELRLAYLDLTDDPAAAGACLERVRAQARDLAAEDLGAAAGNLLGLHLLRQGDPEAAAACFRDVAGYARPVRTAVAAAHLATLDGPLWIDDAVRAVEWIVDPLHLAALHALLTEMKGIDEVLALLPAQAGATPLAALI
ncbi:BTAD domain-containing putative transcriptional regulator [Kutzneria sp. NPDC052558]|uniref:BTAD domain-containing putative transcriptional regulator n=1 Tax=Kutzneria sp. NPDC052558 TaxID=3364121 RepID=UPI0037CC3430